MTRARVAVQGAVLLAAACGTDTSGNPSSCLPTATRVCMVNTSFDPATLSVAAGTTVTWQNADAFGHTATSNPSNPTGCPTWDRSVAGGATSSGVTFATTSVKCLYYCRLHATPTTGAMRASIMVP